MTTGSRSDAPAASPRLGVGSVTDVPGVLLGHHQRTGPGWRTGTTVVMSRTGFTAGVDVRGGGPGTRETDALRPGNLVSTIHAVCLSGGSAYGLAAADGVVARLEQLGLGHPVGADPAHVVPVVPAAVIFDLGRGGRFENRPDAGFGTRATRRVSARNAARGSIGAGTGAISGGLAGGIGSASMVIGEDADRVTVAALAVVNSHGSVIDEDTGLPRVHDGSLTTPSATRRRALVEAVRRSRRGPNDPASGELNTTLVIVTTDAVIDGTEATRIATVAQDGLARAIRPVHSLFDGDTVFTLSTGRVPLTGGSRPGDLNLLSAAAADCAALACTDAVISAEAHSGAPSYTELTDRATRG